jgi:hypothetical protein
MSVTLLVPYQGYAKGAIATFSADVEASLIQQSMAVAAPASRVLASGVTDSTGEMIANTRGTAVARPFGGSGSATVSGYSFVIQIPAEAPFVGVKLIYHNYDTAGTYTIDLAKVAPSAQAGASGTGLVWTSVTFAASASGTVPVATQGLTAGAADRAPGVLVSDMIPVSSLARTDLATGLPLLQVRTYHSGAANAETTGVVTTTAAANALWPTRQFGSQITNADVVTAPTSFGLTPVTGVTYWHPAAVKFYYGGVRSATLGAVGDSLYTGYLGAGDQLGPVHRAAYAMSSTSRPVTPAVYSVTGQHHDASYLTALQVIANVRPDALLIAPWSPNDAISQAVVDKSWAEVLDVVDRCRVAGIVPVLTTQGPVNALYGSGSETIRRAQNARVLSMSGVVPVVDLNAVYEDPAFPGKIRPEFNNGDGLHYTDAGYAAGGQAIRAVVEPLLAV